MIHFITTSFIISVIQDTCVFRDKTGIPMNNCLLEIIQICWINMTNRYLITQLGSQDNKGNPQDHAKMKRKLGIRWYNEAETVLFGFFFFFNFCLSIQDTCTSTAAEKEGGKSLEPRKEWNREQEKVEQKDPRPSQNLHLR